MPISAAYDRRAAEWCREQGTIDADPPEAFAGRHLFFAKPQGDAVFTSRERELDQMLSYLEFLVWAEQGVVTEVCQSIAASTQYRFAPDLQAGALSVREQEAGHSRRAYRLLIGLERAERREARWETPECGRVLDALVAQSPEDEALAKLLLVIFAEVVDFHTATRLIEQTGLAEPIREFALYHEREEILHRVYFRKLLEELVPQLSPEEGRFAAGAIRELLRSFVLDPDQLAADPHESWPSVRGKCGQAIAYLRDTGFFSDPERERRFEGQSD